MFVIKNLDTGLEMRIDDFDKLANIATEEVQVRASTSSKWNLASNGSSCRSNCSSSGGSSAIVLICTFCTY
jgi:hypothetical protein